MIPLGSAAAVFPANSHLFKTIWIKQVGGGRKSDPAWTSQVDAPSFGKALTASLRNHNLLSDTSETAKLILVVNLRNIIQPRGGLNLTVTSEVQYLLRRQADNSKVGGFIIIAPYTAGFSQASYSVTRLRLANEGSIRENISKFLDVLRRLKPSVLGNS
jgi:hypothetical protein